MAKLTLKDLAVGSAIDRHLIKVENDALLALRVARKNLQYSGMKHYPNKAIQDYKNDLDRLDNALDNFNGEWLKLCTLVTRKKEVKNINAIIKSYIKYSTALFILEENSAKHSALVKANVANLVAEVANFSIVVINNANRSMGRLETELRDLAKLLKKAKEELGEAKRQRIYNIIISLAFLIPTPLSLLGRIYIAGAGTLAHMAVDAALGPSKGSVAGTMNTATGEVFGVLEVLSPAMQNFASGLSDLVTLKMDNDEIAEAEMIVKAVKDKLKVTVNTFETCLKIIRNDKTKLLRLEKTVDTAVSAARKNMSVSNSKSRSRQEILKAFKSIDLVY